MAEEEAPLEWTSVHPDLDSLKGPWSVVILGRGLVPTDQVTAEDFSHLLRGPMSITELITALESLRNIHGDLPVYVNDCEFGLLEVLPFHVGVHEMDEYDRQAVANVPKVMVFDMITEIKDPSDTHHAES